MAIIRGHHIENLRAYALRNKEWREHLWNIIMYDKDFNKRNAELFNKILLDEKTSITVIDDFDDICAECKNKAEGGCEIGDIFYPSTANVEKDREIILKYNMQVGATYSNSDFLRNIKVDSFDFFGEFYDGKIRV